MPYNELIKNFGAIRDYMRQFFVYGFRSRDEFSQKSARSYDNERRRVESWLGDAMSFRQDAGGRAVFMSVDSRNVHHNPLYKAYKAKSFTKNDISLHFLLMDILHEAEPMSINEIIDIIDSEYIPAFENALPPEESTLRKKLKEYVGLGLIACEKCGRKLFYSLPSGGIDLLSWREAIAFYSEENPLGVIGSTLLDKYADAPDTFAFKHHYLLFALDSGVILDLLLAIREKRRVQLDALNRDGSGTRSITTVPLKIYISVQGGRQYLAGMSNTGHGISFMRLDYIQKVSMLDEVDNFDDCLRRLEQDSRCHWGVSSGIGRVQHLEMRLLIQPEDVHIMRRLEREKRNGAASQIDETTWLYSVDTYNAGELLPWLRTFIGRILSMECSDKEVERQFWSDFDLLADMYGGGGDAV